MKSEHLKAAIAILLALALALFAMLGVMSLLNKDLISPDPSAEPSQSSHGTKAQAVGLKCPLLNMV